MCVCVYACMCVLSFLEMKAAQYYFRDITSMFISIPETVMTEEFHSLRHHNPRSFPAINGCKLHLRVCVCAWVCVYTYVCVCTLMCVHGCVYVHVYVCVHACVCSVSWKWKLHSTTTQTSPQCLFQSQSLLWQTNLIHCDTTTQEVFQPLRAVNCTITWHVKVINPFTAVLNALSLGKTSNRNAKFETIKAFPPLRMSMWKDFYQNAQPSDMLFAKLYVYERKQLRG